jgi:hypothetical protein
MWTATLPPDPTAVKVGSGKTASGALQLPDDARLPPCIFLYYFRWIYKIFAKEQHININN